MRQLLRVYLLVAAMMGGAVAASAQPAFSDDARTGVFALGALVGAQLDMADEFFQFGGDARMQIARGTELQPRFTYHPLNGGHITQVDANILKNFELANPGRFRPLFGIGGAVRTHSPAVGDGETKLGLNLISGARLTMVESSGYEPFFIAEYTIVHGQFNVFSLVVGASFRLHY